MIFSTLPPFGPTMTGTHLGALKSNSLAKIYSATSSGVKWHVSALLDFHSLKTMHWFHEISWVVAKAQTLLVHHGCLGNQTHQTAEEEFICILTFYIRPLSCPLLLSPDPRQTKAFHIAVTAILFQKDLVTSTPTLISLGSLFWSQSCLATKATWCWCVLRPLQAEA